MKTTKAVLILAFLFLASAQAFAQTERENYGLVVRGKVTGLQIDQSDKNYVRFYIDLIMEFKNEGTEPIILFKPNTDNSYLEDRYWLGGVSLSVNEDSDSIFGYGYWESVSGSDFYRKLASTLDVKTPPSEYTKTLQPNDVWSFADKTEIVFSAKEEVSTYPKRKSWKEMQEFPSKLWLTVSYELSPWNVEYFKPNLIRKLQKRWKQFGNVLVEKKKEGRFNHFGIDSEPMLIDFSQAKVKEASLKN